MEATTTKITKKQKTLLTGLLEDFDGDVEDLLGKHGQVMELKRRGLEAMLEGEFTDNLGDEPHNPRATALIIPRWPRPMRIPTWTATDSGRKPPGWARAMR